jgi:hypothetical protein
MTAAPAAPAIKAPSLGDALDACQAEITTALTLASDFEVTARRFSNNGQGDPAMERRCAAEWRHRGALFARLRDIVDLIISDPEVNAMVRAKLAARRDQAAVEIVDAGPPASEAAS